MQTSSAAMAVAQGPQRLANRVLFGLVVAYASLLAFSAINGHWLFDGAGRPIPTDFINVWAAGKLTLQGTAADAYDWDIHKAMEVVAAGHHFDGYFGWHYPPPFLMVAAGLALFSYPAGLVAWMACTLPLYLAVMRAVAGSRFAILAALAWPATLWNVVVGQNGFLTAALLGGGLLMIERRPLAAGLLIGLLTYKPQFGLLIPIALIAGGHWKVFGSAALTAIGIGLLSASILGVGPWLAFIGSISLTNSAVLVAGDADFSKLQSVFGYVRATGGSITLAWTAHAAFVAMLAAGIIRLWRSEESFSLKAAGLAAATLAASPYVYMYDVVALAVPLAFLGRTGFSARELPVVVVAALFVGWGPADHVPTGLIAVFLVLGLVAARALASPAAWQAQPRHSSSAG
jgi:hypothetical protein